jgi:hypothetical protein
MGGYVDKPFYLPKPLDMARPSRFSLKTLTNLEIRSFEVKPIKP